MASKKQEFEVKQVRTGSAARRLMRKGWEQTGQSGGALMSATVYTMRRPNPKYKGAKA